MANRLEACSTLGGKQAGSLFYVGGANRLEACSTSVRFDVNCLVIDMGTVEYEYNPADEC